jgi:chemotaxis protein methyltransferase CheR
LSDYYTAAYGAAAFDRSLRARTVFAEHSLATDQVFSEMHFISCRNVLIYFDAELQGRAIGLFRDALVHGGFLGLGAHETLRFSNHAEAFVPFVEAERIWRRITRFDRLKETANAL